MEFRNVEIWRKETTHHEFTFTVKSADFRHLHGTEATVEIYYDRLAKAYKVEDVEVNDIKLSLSVLRKEIVDELEDCLPGAVFNAIENYGTARLKKIVSVNEVGDELERLFENARRSNKRKKPFESLGDVTIRIDGEEFEGEMKELNLENSSLEEDVEFTAKVSDPEVMEEVRKGDRTEFSVGLKLEEPDEEGKE